MQARATMAAVLRSPAPGNAQAKAARWTPSSREESVVTSVSEDLGPHRFMQGTNLRCRGSRSSVSAIFTCPFEAVYQTLILESSEPLLAVSLRRISS